MAPGDATDSEVDEVLSRALRHHCRDASRHGAVVGGRAIEKAVACDAGYYWMSACGEERPVQQGRRERSFDGAIAPFLTLAKFSYWALNLKAAVTLFRVVRLCQTQY